MPVVKYRQIGGMISHGFRRYKQKQFVANCYGRGVDRDLVVARLAAALDDGTVANDGTKGRFIENPAVDHPPVGERQMHQLPVFETRFRIEFDDRRL